MSKSNRRKPTVDERSMEKLRYKFESSVTILTSNYGNKLKIIDYLNQNITEFHLTDVEFSRLLNPEGFSVARIRKYKSILSVIDPFLIRNYGYKWDDKGKCYRKARSINSTNREFEIERINTLKGFWIGYSWDKSTTESDPLDKEYIHVFKVEIKDATNVVCETKQAALVEATMSKLIGKDKVAIELGPEQRKIFLIIDIGLLENKFLQTKEKFSLAYIDSGNSKVKAGLAFIVRVDIETYVNTKVESRATTSFDGVFNESRINKMRDTQLILK